jgi:probable HAF family extracellular repeat protein
MQDLGALPGDTAAIAVALSGDGSMVLGMSYATPAGANPRAFLWTAATGIQPIPSITGSARCMSADGSVVAGHMAVGAAIHAFRWTASAGVQDLGTFPAGGNSYAYAISPDGEAIVGTSDITFPGHNHAFLWRANSGMIDLGVLPFGANSIALGVSAAASGPVIVGYSAFSPFLFSFDTGLVDLGAYLEAQGAGTAGWTINTPYAVSADGRTVVGSGFHNGATEGWIARLGPFCYANCDGSQSAPVLNINDYVCFQGRFAGGDPYANCDQSTQPPVLNINDFLCFQTRFAAGCP